MGLVRSLLRGPSRQARAQWFGGAEANRLTLDWIYGHLSADQEIRADLLTLRGRSRELVRNVSWARRYTFHVANNLIGHKGIRLQARLTRPDGLPQEQINHRLERRWAEWSRPENATVDGRLSWFGVQRLIARSMPADGEFLLRLVRGFDNPFGFALQLLDPDQLDHTFNRRPGAGENEIRMGIEVDEWGRPVAYHLWAGHPSEPDGRRERTPVPADQIIHLGDPHRPNQTRHVPWLVSVMLDLNMLRGYFEAELVAARTAAAKGGFFVRKGEEAAIGPDTSTEKLRMDAEPGLHEELPAGMEFQPWDPQHPTQAFPEFTKAMLRSVATGLGISYSGLTNDLTDVNFSSIRAGMLDERDQYRVLQQWLIEHLHSRVYREWVRMAVLSGQLDGRVESSRYAEVEWQPRGWPWVDPEKDMKAAVLAVQHGFNNRRNLVAEQGRDFEEVIKGLQAEEQLAENAGVDIEGPKKGPAGPPGAEATELDDAGNGDGRGPGRFAHLLGELSDAVSE
jgi:lambda family phage portal protein